MRIVFMGTPDIAVPALNGLINAGHEISCVYSQPPRKAGRGQAIRLSPVQTAAQFLGLPVRYPDSLKAKSDQEELIAFQPEMIVVIAYGLILPSQIIKAPPFGCLNIHVSALPRWRGPAPIQRAIMAGDAETGVTIMRMDDGIDTGPLLLQKMLPIGPDATAGDLHDELGGMGAELVVEAISGLLRGDVHEVPQSNVGATYARKLSRDEGRIDWGLPAVQIERNIRALNPWPGAWFEFKGERIRIHRASVKNISGVASAVIDADPTIACGEEALKLEILQRAGRKPIEGAAFLRGFDLPLGTFLGSP